MSVPSSTQRAVAVKGVRKRSQSSDSDSSMESFKGCRDSPSPVRGGPRQRATKSRKLHHKVILETPAMHRHVLEEHLENLWESYGVEFKFVRSSTSQEDLDFYEGPPSPRADIRGPSSSGTARRVIPVRAPGSSDTGEANFRVTACFSTGQPGPAPPVVSKRLYCSQCSYEVLCKEVLCFRSPQ